MAKAPKKALPTHDDLAEQELGKSVPNPLADAARVTVSLPSTVSVRLVDATTLHDYEVFVLMAGLVWSAAVGFGIAWYQSRKPDASGDSALFWMMILCLVLFLITLIMALFKRHRLSAGQKSVSFSLGEKVTS